MKLGYRARRRITLLTAVLGGAVVMLAAPHAGFVGALRVIATTGAILLVVLALVPWIASAHDLPERP